MSVTACSTFDPGERGCSTPAHPCGNARTPKRVRPSRRYRPRPFGVGRIVSCFVWPRNPETGPGREVSACPVGVATISTPDNLRISRSTVISPAPPTRPDGGRAGSPRGSGRSGEDLPMGGRRSGSAPRRQARRAAQRVRVNSRRPVTAGPAPTIWPATMPRPNSAGTTGTVPDDMPATSVSVVAM